MPWVMEGIKTMTLAILMREPGLAVFLMAEENKSIRTEISMKDRLPMDKNLDMESTNFLTEKSMKEPFIPIKAMEEEK